ncbi:MAG TPA: hypothetical protein VHD36_02430 [Pirellulales bacterium]|nr:hypothetical protein [Pirellulales bacterium]
MSTRRLPYAGGNPVSPDFAPDVSLYVPSRGWTASSFHALLAAGHSALTTIFVHGNDTPPDFALRGGTGLYGQLVENPTAPAPPTRFVIWSWPNESTTIRVRKTTQASAARLGIEGYFLACCLSWTAQQGPTSVVGYSSGAGIVTGGLHLLGGGTLEGRRLVSPAPPEASKIHAVLLGAATPNDWLLPGKPHELAWTQLERLVVTVNANDAVLHWYPLLWGRGGPTALGVTGVLDRARLGPAQSKLVELDLRSAMNRNHGWKYYSASPEVANILRYEMISLPASRGQEMSLARQPR